MLVHFLPFPRLAYEIPAHSWRLAVNPSFVYVHTRTARRVGGSLIRNEVAYVFTPTVSPPVMQACRESRQHASYHWAFIIGSEPRHLWVHFETNMICIQDCKLDELDPHQEDIQRLGVFSDGSDESYDDFCFHESQKLDGSPN